MSKTIDAAAAVRMLDAGTARALDVREEDEYRLGHIPGAVLLPLGQVTARAAQLMPDQGEIWLVYCRTGRRSAEAIRLLEKMGYSNLYNLGGILNWPYEVEGEFEGRF